LWDKDAITIDNKIDAEALEFLCLKGVMVREDSVVRKRKFQLLLDPVNGEIEDLEARFIQSQNRLSKFLRKEMILIIPRYLQTSNLGMNS
jgi:hypothetical protein